MPSTTRWSNDDARFLSLRATTAPLRKAGRSTMRFTPTMPTSGWLITGVVTMPPKGPRLVMVMVEPDSSSRPAVPLRTACANRPISAAMDQRSRASAWRITGTISPPSLCVAMPTCTAP
ncbi:hypothetical protein G6F62_014856 [Rhizopus arrhizus]|nr:hypothetical protein G6F62_014856 [Rhizopus arrhizus]